MQILAALVPVKLSALGPLSVRVLRAIGRVVPWFSTSITHICALAALAGVPLPAFPAWVRSGVVLDSRLHNSISISSTNFPFIGGVGTGVSVGISLTFGIWPVPMEFSTVVTVVAVKGITALTVTTVVGIVVIVVVVVVSGVTEVVLLDSFVLRRVMGLGYSVLLAPIQ